ncbi:MULTISPECIES: hypothetical protein [Oceanobacillus]|uniref:Uncharacterized protein n=1 Tax=Oceanobacillus kimchii TaxID=746691 RepID=A0ABQ5TQN1_9BACI|nr:MULTISPECIES: hypothetical protein [Oceanobacillus]MBT2599924.1 hypothetical protein [Oceanobacillus sp. ISL-74]MBT2652626.1 hypothetical protein [Oceanobacillus sp. ISL-73]MCT1577168.1 hypothetical protein [Oceanobacillus kimchii]MCT2135238.1 hypothetical protein [Oceanobacillus kimchii]OEH56506.1 hypothetical protein AQ616_03015 [Oceanobacillus sp. E9]
MLLSGVLKIVGSGFEFILGIPALGGSIILALYWTPLLFMLVYHIITLIFSKNANKPIWGPVVGIVASTVGFIPGLGMMLHWAAFICLLIDGVLTFTKSKDRVTQDIA